jgi:DNA-binding XRE family transcriptional regulator
MPRAKPWRKSEKIMLDCTDDYEGCAQPRVVQLGIAVLERADLVLQDTWEYVGIARSPGGCYNARVSKIMTPRQAKQLREELGLSKVAFAKLLGVSRATVWSMERARKVSVIYDAQIRAARQRGNIADPAWFKVFGQE